MQLDESLSLDDFPPLLERFFSFAGEKILALDAAWDPATGSPVFTREGTYTARGWTEWTQGFQFGCAILQFDATGDTRFLDLGRARTLAHMAPHVSHVGVHDHGFNNISTYGNLRRLARENRYSATPDFLAFCELALKISGAVQAARWTRIADGTGFIHSFNGPHSLFSDTIRSCRSLVLAHQLGHALMAENDTRHSLLGRAIEHCRNTIRYNVWFGEGRDTWDIPGRVAHEGIFNVTDGRYRCPGTQQGYSPFSTWTRGLAWVMLGVTEQLEALHAIPAEEFAPFGGRESFTADLLRAARATCDFYLTHTAADGIPYWDTGAPGLAAMPDWRERPAQPDNPHEPVDSSAAAIAAQALLRLGTHLGRECGEGHHWWQAGLTVARTLLGEPYLSTDPAHQGLVLHSIYHRPNGWDFTPPGRAIPQGESSMWGDYHAMELAVYLRRSVKGDPYPAFFDSPDTEGTQP